MIFGFLVSCRYDATRDTVIRKVAKMLGTEEA